MIRITTHCGQTFTVKNPEKIEWWKSLIERNKLPLCKIIKEEK